MAESSGDTTQLQGLLNAAARGDDQAYADLIAQASDRLLKLTRKMLRAYPHLRRWEETGDIFQDAALRLYRSLKSCRPDSVRDFLGLATLQIRRTLIDLCRHHFGPAGGAAHHDSTPRRMSHDAPAAVDNLAEATGGPSSPGAWADFHDAVAALPDSQREVFQLVWYAGLQQPEVSHLLGISVATVQRRWYQARHLLYERLQGNSPLLREDQ